MSTPPEHSEELPPLDSEKVALIQERLLAWGAASFRPFPWRQTQNSYLGLVAEVMLQRTRASNVVPVFLRFAERFPSPETLAAAEEAEVADIMRPLGLHWRIPLVRQLGSRLVELGHVPSALPDLLALPGVGPYAAAAYLSFHGDGRGVLIDSNVVRWVARLFDRPSNAETRRKRWMKEAADRLTPEERVRDFNYALLDFTMTICVPGPPRCTECPLGPVLCAYGRKALVDTYR